MIKNLLADEIEARMPYVLESPKDEGRLEMIVRRPATDLREVLAEGELDVETGLVGDNWHLGDREPGTQITLMNSRIADVLAGSRERWPLAGDQLYVDLDLSEANLPPGTLLAVGGALIRTTEVPHNGCRKFVERFGRDAMVFVNSPVGRLHHLRGIYAVVERSGTVREGDTLRKTAG